MTARTVDSESLSDIRRDSLRLASAAELFRALGDGTRARIAYALSRRELCVSELAWVCNLSSQAVSYHLRLLRALRLVRFRRDGRHIRYALDDEHVLAVLEQAAAHLDHQ